MKRDRIWIMVTAAFAAVLAFVPNDGGVLGALALPFVAVGWVLRTLSLNGPIGNAVSIVLFVLLCLIPLVCWWRGKRRTEDWLLLLLPLVLGLVLYYMVNPNMRGGLMQNEVGDVIYSFPVWGTLVTWGMLKLLYSEKWVLEKNIYRALRIFLLLCASSCLINCFGTRLASLGFSMKMYHTVIGGSGQYPAEMLFSVLEYLVVVVEDSLCALVLYKGVKLLDRLEEDPFGAECIQTASHVSQWCRRTLTITCLMSLGLNMGQLLFAPLLQNVRLSLLIPVQAMAVSFVMLAVTKLLVRGKELKDETDLFI